MATTSCHSYVSSDFCHCDHVPSVLSDFSHGDCVLSFPSILGDFGHGDRVSYVSSDFGHCDLIPSVLGDFGHGNRVPSFVCFRWFQSLWPCPICFRWFRSWRPRSILSSVIATISRSFLQSWQPRPICFWWFQSLQLCPVHSFSLVISVMTTASHLF